MARKRRERTPAEQRRDEFDLKMRRCLGLIEVYREMLTTFLAADAFDGELVKRMAGLRETVLLLVESAMPVPVDAGRAEEVGTKSRAVH